MRELKFRAWVDEYNEDIEVVGKAMMYCDKMGFKENTYDLSEFFELTELGDPIMQYTGLKDKNGVEIYEGDIITFLHDGDDFVEVVWFGHYAIDEAIGYGYYFALTEGGYGLYPDTVLDLLEHAAEIKGNIYENPELLEEEKNERNQI